MVFTVQTSLVNVILFPILYMDNVHAVHALHAVHVQVHAVHLLHSQILAYPLAHTHAQILQGLPTLFIKIYLEL